MTRAEFLVAFPEFGEVDVTLVDAKLAEALRRIDVDVWGVLADDGQGYLAAHLLSTSPMGNAAKLSTDGESAYKNEYKLMQRLAAGGIRST